MGPFRISVAVGVAAAAMAMALRAAAAASLGAASPPLAAASAQVAACDSDGVGFTRTLNGSQVATITVTSIDAACAGGALNLTVVDASKAAIGGGTATISGSSAQVTLSPQPSVSAITAYAISIVGA